MAESKCKGRTIKVWFEDFWPGFDPGNNAFIDILKKRWTVVLDPQPELLIYSMFGFRHQQYKCRRVCFSGETTRPNLSECDLALSGHRKYHRRHIRFPLWVISAFKHMDALTGANYLCHNQRLNFCSILISHERSKKRIKLFERLNRVRHVCSAGTALNNMGGPIPPGYEAKRDFLKTCRFNIAFENMSIPGYITEKIIDPLIVGCVPVYWGTSDVLGDFNPDCFINRLNFKSDEAMIQRVIEIDDDPELFAKIQTAPRFTDQQKHPSYFIENLLDKIDTLMESKSILVAHANRGTRFFRKVDHRLRTSAFNQINYWRNKGQGNI